MTTDRTQSTRSTALDRPGSGAQRARGGFADLLDAHGRVPAPTRRSDDGLPPRRHDEDSAPRNAPLRRRDTDDARPDAPPRRREEDIAPHHVRVSATAADHPAAPSNTGGAGSASAIGDRGAGSAAGNGALGPATATDRAVGAAASDGVVGSAGATGAGGAGSVSVTGAGGVGSAAVAAAHSAGLVANGAHGAGSAATSGAASPAAVGGGVASGAAAGAHGAGLAAEAATGAFGVGSAAAARGGGVAAASGAHGLGSAGATGAYGAGSTAASGDGAAAPGGAHAVPGSTTDRGSLTAGSPGAAVDHAGGSGTGTHGRAVAPSSSGGVADAQARPSEAAVRQAGPGRPIAATTPVAGGASLGTERHSQVAPGANAVEVPGAEVVTGPAGEPHSASSAPERAAPLQRAPAAVAALLQLASDRGISRARIALKPVELGGIEIRLQTTAGGVAAQVVADSPEAAKLLAQAGDDLRRALEARDVTLLSLEVSTSGEERRESTRGGDRAAQTQASAARTARNPAQTPEPTQPTTTVIELPGGLLVDVLA
jgi:Flagellar hook-length control protein FliK